MKKLLLIAVAAVTIAAGTLVAPKAYACGWFSSCNDATATDNQTSEAQKVANNQSKLAKNVPVPQLNDSLERANISKRLTTFNDPNKVTYIYLVSYGRVMAFYTVKGKITSGSKRLTSTQTQVDSQYCGSGNCSMAMESPELDGTYGNSAPYVYFWTTGGAYIQWSGDYMLSDQPLQLATAPELTLPVK